jgi:hypothetical protein
MPWRIRLESEVSGWWTLFQRGELPADPWHELMRTIGSAVSDAVRTRFNQVNFDRLQHSPALFFAVSGFALLVLAAASRGFSTIRMLIPVFGRSLFPEAANVAPVATDSEVVVIFAVPVVFALTVSALLLALERPSLHGADWRYWAFFVVKTMVVLAGVPVLWIEVSAIVRAQIAGSEYQRLVTGLLFRLIFVFAYVVALRWCVTDQRQRCPVCLTRLSMPVSIGTCSSVFEPAATEFVCVRGHGVMSVPQIETGEPDQLTRFDASWRDLFEAPASR